METEISSQTGQVAVIIPAGGTGKRFGQPKQFVSLAGWPVLAHTLIRFEQTSAIDSIIVVAPYEQVDEVRESIVAPLGFIKPVQVVAGGETRQASVYQGFLALGDEVDLVVIHDGVRPLVKVTAIEEVVAAAREFGGAILALKVRDTLKRVSGGVVQNTLDRTEIWQAQTPQAFRRAWLAEALCTAKRDGFVGTDESVLMERMGRSVRVVAGDAENLKITMPEDLVLAETLIGLGHGGVRDESGTRL